MPRKRRRGFGHGSVWKRAESWWIQWQEKGRRRSKRFTDEDTARKVLAKMLADVDAGLVGLPEAPKDAATLGELAEEWLARRVKTHRSAGDDRSRWLCHLKPRLAKLRPDQVGPRDVRELVDSWLRREPKPLASATCMRVVRLLSTFYTDLCERGLARVNPARNLPGATRRLLRSSHDPKLTPYVEKLSDVERIFHTLAALAEPVALAYAIGSMAGLRTAEILALRWSSVDLERRRIIVSEQLQGTKILRPKDRDSRTVPIMDSLLPVLRTWHLRSGGQGVVVPPTPGGRHEHLDEHILRSTFHTAIATLNKAGAGLDPKMTWYQATRHTFASQWVLAGNSIEKLREVMGHCSVTVTERYAHLRGDAFSAAELGRVAVDFASPMGKVLPMARAETENCNAGATLTSVAQVAQ